MDILMQFYRKFSIEHHTVVIRRCRVTWSWENGGTSSKIIFVLHFRRYYNKDWLWRWRDTNIYGDIDAILQEIFCRTRSRSYSFLIHWELRKWRWSVNIQFSYLIFVDILKKADSGDKENLKFMEMVTQSYSKLC